MDFNQETIKKAAGEAARVMSTLNEWAKKQGQGILKQVELQRRPETLSLHWPKIKQGWLGGFISGVGSGFDLGYRTANKMSDALGETQAVLKGTEREAIETRNQELRAYFGELIGEASMLWSETPKGVFESTKAEAIVDRLMARFQTPMPPTEAELDEANGQERLPGL